MDNHRSEGTFLVDQTPTPTTLIKNCEEVGLFEDLEHVNPFEETFRRAVESATTCSTSSTTLTLPEGGECDESLHTPQVFPNNENGIESYSNFETERCSFFLPKDVPTKVKSKTPDVEQTISIPESKQNEINIVSTESCKVTQTKTIENADHQPSPMIVASIKTDGSIAQPFVLFQKPQCDAQLKPSSQKGKLELNNTSSKCTSRKQPVLLPKTNGGNRSSKIITITVPPNTPTSVITSKPLILPKKPTQTDQDSITNDLKSLLRSVKPRMRLKCKQNLCESSENNDKDDWLKRKRAASSRYRVKQKKEWTSLCKTNTILVEENNKLKEENEKLKQILALHHNCQLVQLVPIGNCSQTLKPQIILESHSFQPPAKSTESHVLENSSEHTNQNGKS